MYGALRSQISQASDHQSTDVGTNDYSPEFLCLIIHAIV